MMAAYKYEDIRRFFAYRMWLHGESSGSVITSAEYRSLMDRTLKFTTPRAVYLRAYLKGWTDARR